MTWLSVLFAIAWPPVWAAFLKRFLVAPWELHWAVQAGALVLVDAAMGVWLAVLAAALNVLAALFWWWWNRRRRDRARAWLGEKYKALRDALVRKQREVTKPRRVLRPVPGSAS